MISLRWLPLLSTLLSLTIPFLATKANPETADNPNCPEPALSRLKRHQITAGETLESIASQYNLIPATLMGMNPVLQKGQLPIGTEIVIPPYNGIRVEVRAGQTWKDVATAYKVRPDVLFEINGCQNAPQVVFVPGVNWSPTNPSAEMTGILTGYPLPEDAPVILGYGWQLHPLRGEVAFHSGVDLQASVGTPILAAGDGTIAFAGEQGNYGNLVVVNHAAGKQTRYAHLAGVAVKVGQQVVRGEQLGTVGTTGSPDKNESHLHFEVRYSSKLGWVAEDPQGYLRSHGRKEKEEGRKKSSFSLHNPHFIILTVSSFSQFWLLLGLVW